MKIIKSSLIIFYVLTLTACAAFTRKEVARIPIDSIGNADEPEWKETKLDLKKGEKIWFWTDMDVSYDNDLVLEYNVQLIKGSDTLELLKLRPFDKNISVIETKSEVLGHTDWSFQGQMGEYDPKEAGTYTFRALLLSSTNESVRLKKADLVLKK